MTSTAMPMLSKGKKKIDVMIINANSREPLSFKLLDQAVALDIISLFVCDKHNSLVAKKALNAGAYLYLKKPIHEEIVKYLSQFVLRKTNQKKKIREGLEENGEQVNVISDPDDIGNNDIVGDEEQVIEKNVPNTEEHNNNINEAGKNIVSNVKYKLRRKRGRKSTKETNKGESQSSANNVAGQMVCIEWTIDLHTKFMEAVQQLGEGRCFPKDILKVMQMSGLTKMQVASHLQKCRNNNWRAPKERKLICHPSGQGSSSGSQQRSSFKKFGTLPRLQTNVLNLKQQQCNPDQTQSSPKFPISQVNTNNICARGESLTQQQFYHPQLPIQPHYPNIGSSFSNTFLSVQNNVGGGIQQHRSLFGILDSQGLQGLTIGSINSRPGLTFNNEDHHTQNDYDLEFNVPYDLDLNVPYVTTNSGSTIMSDTDIENATSNELGAVNANFQQYVGEPSMSDPINIIATSHASDTEGSDSNDGENYGSYLNCNSMDYGYDLDLNVPYDLDLTVPYVTTNSGSKIMSDADIENGMSNELELGNANFQQYIGEPSMPDPSNIIAASHAIDTEGSDSNDRENYGSYLNSSNMDYII